MSDDKKKILLDKVHTHREEHQAIKEQGELLKLVQETAKQIKIPEEVAADIVKTSVYFLTTLHKDTLPSQIQITKIVNRCFENRIAEGLYLARGEINRSKLWGRGGKEREIQKDVIDDSLEASSKLGHMLQNLSLKHTKEVIASVDSYLPNIFPKVKDMNNNSVKVVEINDDDDNRASKISEFEERLSRVEDALLYLVARQKQEEGQNA